MGRRPVVTNPISEPTSDDERVGDGADKSEKPNRAPPTAGGRGSAGPRVPLAVARQRPAWFDRRTGNHAWTRRWQRSWPGGSKGVTRGMVGRERAEEYSTEEVYSVVTEIGCDNSIILRRVGNMVVVVWLQ